jgi:hypothetical protein
MDEEDQEALVEMIRRDPSLLFVLATLCTMGAVLIIVYFPAGVFAIIFFTLMFKRRVQRWKRQNLKGQQEQSSER